MKCLLQDKIAEFRKALKEKDIKIEELLNMTSDARTKLLEKYAGSNAADVNLLFEEKLVLKNRMMGIKNWASKVGEIGRYDPAKKAKLAELQSEYRAKQQERIFSPKENEQFLSALAEEKIGARISKEEASNLFEMSSKVDKLKENYADATNEWLTEATRIEYATTKAIYTKYVDDLKAGNLTIKDMLKGYKQELNLDWANNAPKTILRAMTDATATVVKTLISGVASWDNSFLGRQGAITLLKSPKTWWNMAKKSHTDIIDSFRNTKIDTGFKDAKTGESIMLKKADLLTYILKEEMMSRPNGMNGNYDKAKLFPGVEEETPIKLMEKLPGVLGKGFKASDVAFNNSAIRARADLFDMMLEMSEKVNKKGENVWDTTNKDILVKDIGLIVNSITARGKLGAAGSSKIVQLVLWAPKMLKADWDILTAHTFGSELQTKFARVQAVKTITSVVVATAAIAAIAQAMGAEVEKDPRSSDFLQIKVGDTRFRIPFTRGMTQIVTLIARIGTQSTKSSRTGVISKLNDGEYFSRNLFDVGLDFLTNKTTPPVSAVISWMKGKNFEGKKPTVGSTAFGFLPIAVQNFIGLKDQKTIEATLGAFLDVEGISSNTYSSDTDWGENMGVVLKQFKEKVGDKRFQEANDKFNKNVTNWLDKMKLNTSYQKLSNEDKEKVITKKKTEIKDLIFHQYSFQYREPLPKLLPRF